MSRISNENYPSALADPIQIRSGVRQSPGFRMIWVFQQLPQCRVPCLEDLLNFVQIYLLIPVTSCPASPLMLQNSIELDVLSNSGYTSNHAACGSPPGISGVEEVGELWILFDVLCRNTHHVIIDSAEELPFVWVKGSADSRVDS